MHRIILFSLLWISTPGMAGVVLDQHQIAWSPVPNLAVGGPSEQQVSQTFEAGITGRIDHLSLVFTCEPTSKGLFTVEIQTVGDDGLPDGGVLGSVSLDSSTLTHLPVGFQDIVVPGVDLMEGMNYAIVMRADNKAECLASEGPVEGHPFSYPRGSAYVDARPNPPGWIPFGPPGIDLPFHTYMRTAELTGPLYCAIEDASGMPNDWLPNHVPVCGCLSDPASRVNRCWFAFPGFNLWRDIEIFSDRPHGKLRWNVLPFDSHFPGVSIEETAIDGDYITFPLQFPAGLSAGKPAHEISTYKGRSTESRVAIKFPGPSGTVESVFRTRFENPPNSGQ